MPSSTTGQVGTTTPASRDALPPPFALLRISYAQIR
jgi:hypothetical protein